MNSVRNVVVPFLLVAAVTAQGPGVWIPAGNWTVRELLAHAEQALDTRIHVDPAELARAAGAPVRLQHDLAIDATWGPEAVTALLSSRGLCLVEDRRGNQRAKAVVRGAPDWLREAAVATDIAALFGCPHRNAVVRLELATDVPAELLHVRLHEKREGVMPEVVPGEAGIAITGGAGAVRRAVCELGAMDPEVAAAIAAVEPPPTVAYSTMPRPVELPAGEYRIQDLVDQLAVCCGINIALAPDVAASTGTIPVAQSMRLDWRTAPRTLPALLWQRGLLLLELDPRHGLYEVVGVDRDRPLPPERAQRRECEELATIRDLPLFIAVLVPAKDLDATALPELVRVALGESDPATAMLTAVRTTDGYWISGMAAAVAAVVDAMPLATPRGEAGAAR